MRYQELVNRIQAVSEVAPEVLANNRGFAFNFPKFSITINCELDKEERTLSLYSAIGEVPSYEEEDYLKMLLEGHLFGTSTGLCTFGYEEETNTMYLFRTLELEYYEPEDFKSILADMFAAVEFWKEQTKYAPQLKQETESLDMEWGFYDRI